MEAEIDEDPKLAAATVINAVVADLLYLSNFQYPDYPELVDLAVVATGLGVLRSRFGFVNKSGAFWDSTQWMAFPRPFLDAHGMAYTNAVAAWARDESAPEWAADLTEVKRPMRSSLKFLHKTGCSFFQPSQAKSLLGRPQSEWWQVAASGTPCQQVVALRHLASDDSLSGDQEQLLSQKLQSNNRAIALHAVDAAARLNASSDDVVRGLRELVSDNDEELRSKSMCVVTQLGLLDQASIDTAADMLDSSTRHNVFAGLYALASQDSVPDYILPPVDRAFKRALKACDYEFVGLFIEAYKRWNPDPQAYLQELLQDDSPEYLQIATDALEGTPQEVVSIG